jgi:DNA-damage-inducible protein J
MKSAIIRARTEAEVKEKAEAILAELGMNSSQVINMLYRQIIYQKGLPFEVSLPNATTLAAIHEEEGTVDHGTPEQLFKDLGI